MTYFYITTDASEAEELIEHTELEQKPKYGYHDIEISQGQEIAKRIGFRPMCSVEVNDTMSARGLEAIATSLVKEGLFVAVEGNKGIQKYIPSDAKEREELVKLSLQKTELVRGVNSSLYLLLYSNNPNKIREFGIFGL